MNDILLGKSVLQPADVWLRARYGNRHGMVAGATGSGKSVSLMVMAEGFSRLGVPVFLADVKGDLAGLSLAAVVGDKLKQRIDKLGHPVRATVSEMGPLIRLGQGYQRCGVRHEPAPGHDRGHGEVGGTQRRRPARPQPAARRAWIDHAEVTGAGLRPHEAPRGLR